MKLIAYKDNQIIDEWLVFSVGGGEIKNHNQERNSSSNNVYKHENMRQILEYCDNNNISFYDYVVECEGKEIIEYGDKILTVMFNTVERGLYKDDKLPGDLNINRRAKGFYEKYLQDDSLSTLAFAASMAASEENASGGEMVTAPTCGASGVVPGVLYTYYKRRNYSRQFLIEALLVGGLIGNIVKSTGSISGAEVGCQGEVGVACAMASASVCYMLGGTNKQIEYAAEIALEHHLGLTCDPVKGYVQIPCIERNAMSCKRALDCAQFALLTDGNHYIKLDDAIQTMVETGKDLHHKYRETSEGGLAKIK
jgi:L-serine dehydratase